MNTLRGRLFKRTRGLVGHYSLHRTCSDAANRIHKKKPLRRQERAYSFISKFSSPCLKHSSSACQGPDRIRALSNFLLGCRYRLYNTTHRQICPRSLSLFWMSRCHSDVAPFNIGKGGARSPVSPIPFVIPRTSPRVFPILPQSQELALLNPDNRAHCRRTLSSGRVRKSGIPPHFSSAHQKRQQRVSVEPEGQPSCAWE